MQPLRLFRALACGLALAWAVTPARAQSTAASKASELSKSLGETYQALRAESPLAGVANRVETLQRDLASLHALGAQITALSANTGGVDEPELFREASQQRAMAWLHGWAGLSQALTRMDRQPPLREAEAAVSHLAPQVRASGGAETPEIVALRQQLTSHLDAATAHDSLRQSTEARLTALDAGPSPSALRLLVDIYRQIAADAKVAEPLQTLLADGNLLIIQLVYQEKWKPNNADRPATITHPFYIPSRRDLVGAPDDLPQAQRRIFSFWALANWQCDQQQPLERDVNGQVAANRVEAPGLIHWLETVETDEAIKALDQPGEPLAGDLQARLGKGRRYLQFRQQFCRNDTLAELAKKVREARIAGQPARTLPGLDLLVEAARPLGQEFLYPAAAWLRYLFTLSYQDDGESLLDPGIGLAAIWQKEGLEGDPFVIPTMDRHEEQASGLRWNAEPAAGHSSRVQADLSQGMRVLLSARRQIREHENERIAAIGYRPFAAGYGFFAKQQGVELRAGLDTFLAKYAAPTGSAARNGTLLQESGHALAGPFRASATAEEQGRITEDLAALLAQVRTAAQVQELVASAYATNDPELRGALLKQVAGFSGISDWNVYAMPSRSFRQYAAQLNSALDRLALEIDAAINTNELRQRFEQRQRALEIAEESLALSHLGQEVASRATTLAKIFGQVAEIDAEIADLEVKASELELRGFESSESAKRTANAYAGRLRDLAAGRVEAIMAAAKLAVEITRKAETQLEQLKNDLPAVARKIRDQRDHDAFMSVVNGVVLVVGAVLAPFTGGASLSIAVMASQAIKTIDRMTQGPWKGLASLAEIAQVVNQGIQTATSLGVDFGVDSDLSLAFTDAQKFLSGDAKNVAEIGTQGQQIIQALQSLEKGDLTNFASAIASGFPATLESGAAQLNLAVGKQFALPSTDLESSLSRLFSQGGISINSFMLQNDAAETLLVSQGPLLRAQLRDAVEHCFQQIPDDTLLQRFNPNLQALKQDFASSKTQLLAIVQGLPEAEAQAFAALLGRGLIFAQTAAGKVVAVQPEIAGDLQKFQDRLKRFEEKVVHDNIKTLVQDTRTILSETQAQADALIQQNNDAGLEAFVNNVLPTKFEQLQGKLNDLNVKVAEARDALDDENTKVRIAQYEAEASTFFTAGSRARNEVAQSRARKAALGRSVIAEQLKISELQLQSATLRGRISQQEVAAARAELLAFYESCLARGVNPRARVPQLSDADGVSGVLLSRLLVSARTADGLNRDLQFDSMAGSLIGMLKWINLLDIRTTSTEPFDPLSSYVDAVNALARKDDQKIKALGLKLEKVYDNQFADMRHSQFIMLGDPGLKEARITWFDETIPEPAKRTLLQPIPPGIRREAIGVFRFVVSTENVPAATEEELAGFDIPPDPTQNAYYLRVKNILLLHGGSADPDTLPLNKLQFLVVPPAHPVGHPRSMSQDADPRALASDPIGRRAKVLESIEDSTVQDQLNQQVLGIAFDNPLLLGIYGEWTFYLFSTVPLQPQEMRNLREKLQLKLKMPALQIPTQ